MKRYLIVSYILAFVTVFQSCDMKEMPYTIDKDMAKTPQGAAQVVTAMYNTFWSTYLMKKTYMEVIDMDQDHAAAPSWVVSGAGEGNITTHWAYNQSSDPFRAFYTLINRANFALESISVSPIDEATRNQYLGEAYFLRAFAYFHLVRMYGPVPLRVNSEDLGDRERSPVKDVYQLITDDLDEACVLLQWQNVGSWGHANKTAAKLLLARVYATMGSASLAGHAEMYVDIKGVNTHFNTEAVAGFEEIDSEACYQKVKDICDEVIARRDMEFGLMTAFNKIWGADNVRNKEFVWGIVGNNQTEFTTEHLNYYYTAPTYYGRGWAGISVDAYNLYQENDERGEQGIFHYVKQTYNNTAAYVRVPNDAAKYPTGPDGTPSRGVNDYYNIIFITKWYMGKGTVDNPEPDISAPGYAYTPQDIPMIRFVDAYLLRAEALNELGRPGDALADLDVVRGRAKASLLSGLTSDKVEIRSFVLRERAMEFVQEFNRKFDLLRWGLYLGVMNKTSFVKVQGTGLTISKVRQPRCLLYAVPLNEINNNKLFGLNNAGW